MTGKKSQTRKTTGSTVGKQNKRRKEYAKNLKELRPVGKEPHDEVELVPCGVLKVLEMLMPRMDLKE